MSKVKAWMRKRRAEAETSADQASPRSLQLSGTVPMGAWGDLCRVRVNLVQTEDGEGHEALHLSAHVETRLASVLRPAIESVRGPIPALVDAPAGAGERRGGSLLSEVNRVAGLARRSVARARWLDKALDSVAAADVNSWVDIRASTANLDQGAHALVSEKLQSLGVVPQRAGDAPSVETWRSDSIEEAAELTVIQVDKRHLPVALHRWLGDRPFQLSAVMGNTLTRPKKR